MGVFTVVSFLDTYKDMTNNIDYLREKAGLTVVELADKSGISRGYLNKLKAGRQRLNTDVITKLSKALGCKPGEIISDDHGDEFAKVAIIDSIPADGFKNGVNAPVKGYLPHKTGSNTLIAVRVEDEAMNQIAPVGSYIVIDYSKVDPKELHNKTVVAYVEGRGALFRKFMNDPERLETNTNRTHETIVLKGDWHIIGRVVSVVTDLDNE